MKYTVLSVPGRLVLDIEAYHHRQVRYLGHQWNAETKSFDAATEPFTLTVSPKYKSHYTNLFKDGDLVLLFSEN